MYTKFTYVYIKFVFVRIQNLHAYVLYNRQTEKYTEEKKEKENRKRYERKNRKKKKENRTPARPVRRLLSTRDICPVTRGRRSATSRLLAISPTTRGCNMAKDKRTTLHARTWYATTHIVVGATQNLNGFAIKHWI